MSLEEYMKLPYMLIIIPDEGGEGYVPSYPDLKGCITCAGDASRIVEMAEDAKRCWIETALEEGISIPLPSDYVAA